MVSFGLVEQGWDNLVGLFEGKKTAKDILTPGTKDIFGQIRRANDPQPAVIGGAGQLVKETPEIAKDVVEAIGGNKYLKCAAIGGAALIGLAILRRK